METVVGRVHKIVTGPSSSIVCAPTTLDEIKSLDLWSRLEATLNAVGGLGLAAPQIGIPLQAAIVRTPKGFYPWNPDGIRMNLWNPKLEIEGKDTILYKEGCLSFPGQFWMTKRWRDIVFTNGDGRKYVAEGSEAVVLQHEIGHLTGHTFLEYKAYEATEVGRNDPCPCGSGKKFKKCCLV